MIKRAHNKSAQADALTHPACFRRWASMILNAFVFVSFGLLVSGCLPPEPVRHAHAPMRASLVEGSLVSVVAQDFATHTDCDYGSGQSGIVVNALASASRSIPVNQLLANTKPADWRGFEPLVTLLHQRNPSDRPIDWGISSGDNLKIRSFDNIGAQGMRKLATEVRCFGTFALPAISPDGSLALVAFHVGPAPHGASALYALRRETGQWRVSARSFLHFL